MKKLITLALLACFVPIALPQSSRANPAVLGAAGCAASGVCGLIVGTAAAAGVLYYRVQTRNGRTISVPSGGFTIHRYPQPQARPTPREFQQNSPNQGIAYNKATETFTLSTSRNGCKDKEKRVKKTHPDWELWLDRMVRNPNLGTPNEIACIWRGRHRTLLERYYK